jgi:chaperonin cofactor prefoldin
MDELNKLIRQVGELMLETKNRKIRKRIRKNLYELLKKKHEKLEESEESEE